MRRSLVMLSMIMGALTTLSAAPAWADSHGHVDRYEESIYRVNESAGDGLARTLVENRVVDRQDNVLSKRFFKIDNASEKAGQFRAADALPFACSHDGYRAGFTPHPMKEVYQGGPKHNDFVQFQFFPYSQSKAREDPFSHRPEQQWLFCATGGVDSNNGSRLVISGPGVAYGDSKNTWKIGQIWREGSTPANYSVSLGFQTEGPIKVNGGVQQTPTSSLRGSPRPPYQHELDVFSRNAANGWWQDSCAPDCTGTGGSTNFQGSVVEGLWEFPESMSVMVSDFAMSGWKKTFCSNPFGCRP